MNSTNPYLPPASNVELQRATGSFRLIAARLLTSVAVVFGLVVVCYAIVLGFEWSTPGASVLPSLWFQINAVGVSGICGLIAAIIAVRCYRLEKNRVFRLLLVFFILAVIANISASISTVYSLAKTNKSHMNGLPKLTGSSSDDQIRQNNAMDTKGSVTAL